MSLTRFRAINISRRWVSSLGAERLKQAAQLLGIGAYDTPVEALRGRKEPELWNASTDAVKRALAPREATIVTGKQVTQI